MKSRRNFIRKVAFASATATLSGTLVAQSIESQQLYHQVFFWLKPEVNVEEFVIASKMLAKCKSVLDFKVGTPADTTKRPVIDDSYSVACLVIFDSVEAHDSYQKDPIHLHFIEDHSAKWTDVKIYDFFV